ncbi:MAG: ABC transporter permease [Candidatus Krumholzibacteria bacterium]|nr:ABC transporter permease [Candidatus Krumholzibacteria bacterium]
MTRVAAIYRRELLFFFNSAAAYTVMTVFVLLAGYFFYNLLAYFNLASIETMQNPVGARGLSLTESVVRPLFANISVVMLLILPLLTMRLFSEERKSGTAELLFTYPISDWDAILGKYLAAVTVYASMLALTVLYPLLLAKYTSPEPGPILTGYLGLFLIGAAYIAMGLFFSSLSENQLVAGVATFGCGLLFLIAAWLTPFVSPGVAVVLHQLSILEHFESFSRGILDSNDVVYYLNFTVFFLFLTSRVLDSHRWRG